MTATERKDPQSKKELAPQAGAHASSFSASLILRSAFGGLLMGLANLVPGISGGTMLLVSGIYPKFVQAVAEVSTLRFRLSSLTVLASVAASAILAIGLLAGPVKDLVVMHAWLAYSLFIGLTLGGIPILWKMIESIDAKVWGGALAGLAVMTAVAWMQHIGAFTSGGADDGLLLLGLAGVGGAAAMVLPGISGGYILLVLGQYVPILSAVSAVRDAVGDRDLGAALDPAFHVLLPVAVGVAVGVVVVSNLIKLALERAKNVTLGVLLGLLCGAVLGLWPFSEPVEPSPGDVLHGQVLTEARIAEMSVDSWPTKLFTPSEGQLAAALGLVLLGFSVTTLVAWAGRRLEQRQSANTPAEHSRN